MIFNIHQPDQPFTIIMNRTINDERLGDTILSLLVYLLSKPPTWEPRREELAKRFKVHPNTITNRLRQLRDAGYARIIKIRNENGTISGTAYDIYGTADSQPVVTRTDSQIDRLPSSCEYSKTEGKASSNRTANPQPSAKEKEPEREKTENEEVVHARAREAEDMTFLGDDLETYGALVQEVAAEFEDFPDRLIYNRFGRRNGVVGEVNWIAARIEKHGWPKVAAAIVITGDQAEKPNLKYADRVLRRFAEAGSTGTSALGVGAGTRKVHQGRGRGGGPPRRFKRDSELTPAEIIERSGYGEEELERLALARARLDAIADDPACQLRRHSDGNSAPRSHLRTLGQHGAGADDSAGGGEGGLDIGGVAARGGDH